MKIRKKKGRKSTKKRAGLQYRGGSWKENHVSYAPFVWADEKVVIMQRLNVKPWDLNLEAPLDDGIGGGAEPEPFLGMRFDTLAGAKEHYNAYARVKCFSIKANTSRKPKNMDDAAGQSSKVRKKESSSDDEPVDANEGPLASQKVVKRRRRESIKETECKAKMTVKLKDGRWEVIFFVVEHNHELITKPSLTKYLLSHKNISPEEEDFLRATAI
ncbi:hypothetical protein BRADI_4g21230v3 [Brachypodium distachyon]|uniref:FAR1 domain-containing protein n=1 Tax=Brachypodium distachyon TaxID=15368 RepID=I1IMA1_BRADI|nr:hypothetical protein BRADI_4g21230v3 [Brachypodium distachyon]